MARDERGKFIKGNNAWEYRKKDFKHSEITKERIRKKKRGHHDSPNTEFKKGHIMPMVVKNKISNTLKGRRVSPKTEFKKGNIGEKCINWKGGISFEPYSTDWTETLKRSIRQRDRYTCQICGIEPAIHVHHIDYDKKNCNPDNLITLCHSCHSKTNSNRSYWLNYFSNK
jgi:hypothetical protein